MNPTPKRLAAGPHQPGAPPRRLVTRKEVADLAGVSYDVIRRNEARLGLDRSRVQINKRIIFYRADDAREALPRAGLRRAPEAPRSKAASFAAAPSWPSAALRQLAHPQAETT
jgi:hypothetical protein